MSLTRHISIQGLGLFAIAVIASSAIGWWLLRPASFDRVLSMKAGTLAGTGELWVGEAAGGVLFLATFDGLAWKPDQELLIPDTANLVAFEPGTDRLHGMDARPNIIASSNSLSQIARTAEVMELLVDGTAVRGGKRLATAGPHFLDRCVSPDGKKIAVLSADGLALRSLIPFLGGTRVTGRRYHQVFDKSTGLPFGPTLELAGPGEKLAKNCMWSPDGRYVIYHGGFSPYVWIVDLGSE